jgi:hypothetical protein
MNESRYVPGVCNIGDTEIAQRNKIGWIGIGITIVLGTVLVYLHVAFYWRLIIFLPAFMGAAGFLQAWMHFCAGFGMQGVFNFSSEVRKTDTVAQAEYRAMDRRKAIMIFIYAALIAAALTVLVCLMS